MGPTPSGAGPIVLPYSHFSSARRQPEGDGEMAHYEYGGASDIDRAIGVLVRIDTTEHNAIAMMQMDDVLVELQEEYDRCG